MRILYSALVLVAACSTPERSPDASNDTPRPNASAGIDSLIAAAPAHLRDSAEALNREARDSGGLLLSVWPRHDSVVFDRTRFAADYEHPCGFTLSGRFRTVPDDDSLLRPERVVELDSSGSRLREWRVPTDLVPAAVQGDEVFMTDRRSFVLGLRPDGSYRVVPPVPFPSSRHFACRDVFPQSAYETCEEFQDLRTRTSRRLAYEAPCG